MQQRLTTKNNKQKTNSLEQGPGKSSLSKTQMVRNLSSTENCSDHQFEPIHTKLYTKLYRTYIRIDAQNTHKI